MGVKHTEHVTRTLLVRFKKRLDEISVSCTMALAEAAPTADTQVESENVRSSRTSTPIQQTEEVCTYCPKK